MSAKYTHSIHIAIITMMILISTHTLPTPHTPHIIVNAYLKKSYIENHFQHGQLFNMACVLCEFFPFSWQQTANELKI